jgi:hypothetical protein
MHRQPFFFFVFPAWRNYHHGVISRQGNKVKKEILCIPCSLFQNEIMKVLFSLIFVVISFTCLIFPVSSESGEEPDPDLFQNLSLSVPPTGTAILGTDESMHEYKNWLDECAHRLTNYSNQVLTLLGMREMDWTENLPVSEPVTTLSPVQVPVATVQTPDPLGDSPTLMTVTTITGESGSQSVNVIVPYGYWEMWYTADPVVTGAQDSHSATGTNSAVFPSLSVVIRNAATGERIETVEPPGGLDIYLWQRSGDPRPWSKKFYEGENEYTFDMTARHLKSYLIEVRVPKT